MRFMVVFGVALALTGCATGSYWLYPPGGTEEQWHRDVYECTQEAQQGSSSAYVNPYGGAAQSGTSTNYELRNACLRARGYRESATEPSRQAPVTTNQSCEWFKDFYAKQRNARRHPNGTKLTSRGFAFECRNGTWDYIEDHDNQVEKWPRAEDVEI